MKKIASISVMFLFILWIFLSADVQGDDLPEITKKGYIQHLGIPYANFVTGSGDGFSVELIQGFADFLGLKYVYVQTTWAVRAIVAASDRRARILLDESNGI